jgi:hypothetical protein
VGERPGVTDRAATFAGGQVVIAGAVAARIAPGLRRWAESYRRSGFPIDQALAQVLAAFDAAERAHPRRLASVPATRLDPTDFAAPSSGQVLAVAEVAQQTGVSGQAVRKAAASGRLVGRLGGDGRWRFTEDAVRAWQKSRRERSA